MGIRQSHMSHIHNYESERSNTWIDYINITETQYGSWTKLSLTDPALYRDGSASLTSTSPDSSESSDENLEVRDEMPPSCTRLLTQPPSQQQDYILREVAEKLLDPDVTPSPSSSSPPPPPPPHKSTNTSTPLPQGAKTGRGLAPSHQTSTQHYSLNLCSPICSKEGIKRKQIAKSFLNHFELLVRQIDPEDVAHKLYGIAVIDTDEMESASNREELREERTRNLIKLLKKKLWANPEWFVDVCKILRNCDVTVISDIIDEVQSKCPTDETSILSTHSHSFSSRSSGAKNSLPGRQASYHNTFEKLEKSYKKNGLKGASEYVAELCANQPDLLLLHEACQNGVDVSNLDLLLTILSERGNHNIDSKNECGQTPLHIACASLRSPAESDALDDNNTEQRLKIEHLLTHKASNWLKDKDGNTPLHLAILRSDAESVSILLESGKRCLNSVNKRGNSGLHLACRLGLVGIVKTLCSYNANTSIQNKKMRTALHLACIHDCVATAMDLASHDPSTMDAFDRHCMTPLHIACKKTNGILAISLLKLRNCFPNKADKENKTPLHYACSLGSLSVVVGLLGKDCSKAFMDAQDTFGDTALHIASRHGYKDVVKELLNRKASREILNQDSKNPLEVAIEYDHESIAAKMLRKRGWNQRRRRLRKVRKLRKTQTQSSVFSSPDHSECLEMLDHSSSESEADETISLGIPSPRHSQ